MGIVRRILKWLCIALLICAVAWTLWNWRATVALENAVAELAAAGLPTTTAQLPDGVPHVGPAPARDENAAYHYKAAFALLETVEELEEYLSTGATKVPEAWRLVVPQYRDALELVEKAVALPRCRFELSWEDGFQMLVPQLLALRNVSTALVARTLVRLEDGDVQAALGDVRTALGLSRALAEEPLLISQLVRLALATRGVELLQRVLPHCPNALEVLETLDVPSTRGAVVLGLRGEAVVAVHSLEQLLTVDVGLGLYAGRFTRLFGPYLKSALANSTRAHIDFVAQVEGKPYVVALPIAEKASSETAGYEFAAMLVPNFRNSLQQEARLASRIAVTRLGASCLDQRRRAGKFPARLDELPKPPLDPLTGEAFLLEVQGDGLVLRSGAAGEEVHWELR